MSGEIRRAIWLTLLLVSSGAAFVSAYAVAYPSAMILVREGLGEVYVNVPGPTPKGLVVLLTGESGWDPHMRELADSITGLGYVVAGISSSALLAPDGLSASSVNATLIKMASLSDFLATQYHIVAQHPVIVGYGPGAMIVYNVLALAPANVFHAGISVNFCLPPQGLTRGAILPATQLKTTWFVFPGASPCDANATADFVRRVGNARIDSQHSADGSSLPSQNQTQQVTALLQWLDPRIVEQMQTNAKIGGVPLVEVPAAIDVASVQSANGGSLAVFLSGDGGWAELDRTVAGQLAAQGVAVAGWDSLSYFWQARTPEEASRDLDRVLRHYLQVWQPKDVFLIGYSFGANVLPFMASRLAPDLRERIKVIVLISPEPQASFEFHLSDWLGRAKENTLPLMPEVAELRWSHVLCLYGDAERSSPCPVFAEQGVSVLVLGGDHHFNGDYIGLARQILDYAASASLKAHTG